jgi:hypothetical protein
LTLSRSTGGVPERCWCWGSWTELRRESFEVDGDSGAGDATRPFSREGRRDAAEAKETDGLCKVGTGGGFEQTWSPSSESGTGKLQLEHLTEGKSWDMRAGEFVGAGERREAIMVETIVGVYLSRPALIVLCRQGSNVAASVQGRNVKDCLQGHAAWGKDANFKLAVGKHCLLVYTFSIGCR